jgi:hypothetical protein
MHMEITCWVRDLDTGSEHECTTEPVLGMFWVSDSPDTDGPGFVTADALEKYYERIE